LLPRTDINIIELKQSEGFDRLDKNTQALALLLHEQRYRPRIEYENLNLTIISEHNQTREVVLQGNAQIIKEIWAASDQAFDITHNTPNSGEHADTKEDVSVGTKTSNDILAALTFPGMGYRQDQVSEAHARTFGWIFDDPRADTRPWNSFANWLKNVSGKLY